MWCWCRRQQWDNSRSSNLLLLFQPMCFQKYRQRRHSPLRFEFDFPGWQRSYCTVHSLRRPPDTGRTTRRLRHRRPRRAHLWCRPAPSTGGWTWIAESNSRNTLWRRRWIDKLRVYFISDGSIAYDITHNKFENTRTKRRARQSPFAVNAGDDVTGRLHITWATQRYRWAAPPREA